MHTSIRTAVSSPWGLAVKLSTIVLAGMLIFGVACSSNHAAKLDNPDQTGSELVNKYITLLQNKDVDGLKSFLSDAFIIQRADGSTDQKTAYLQSIPDIGDFTIKDVTALQANDVLIVRWQLTVHEVINGQPYDTQPAPRLSTFVYQGGDWHLTSHANFNAPEADASPQAAPTTTGQ